MKRYDTTRGSMIIAVVVLIVASLLAGCPAVVGPDSPGDSGGGTPAPGPTVGTLTVTVGGNLSPQSTIAPDLSMEISSYVITVTGPGDTQTRTIIAATPSATFDALAPGTWNVVANAKNVDGIIIARDSIEVAIVAGQTATASLTVRPLPDHGTLNLSISWPQGTIANPVVQATLQPFLGTADSIAFTIDGTTATYSGAHAPGYYQLSLTLKDGATVAWPLVVSVRIIDGQVSSGVFTLTEADLVLALSGSLLVNVGEDLNNPYTVTFNGLPAEMEYGQQMTVEAILNPTTAPDEYFWYLNGELVAGESGPSIIIGPEGIDAPPGVYWLDVMVRKGTMLSSQRGSFRILATDLPISLLEVPGVTVPGVGVTPVTTITETVQYTGTVEWSPSVATGFSVGIEYTALITLTPKAGYTLIGVAANTFTVAGATSVTHSADSGVITAVFPLVEASTPIVLSTTPSDGSIDVDYSPGTSLTIIFDQDMQNSWSISTNQQGLAYSPQWIDLRTLRITFTNGLSPGYSYSVTLNATNHVSMASTAGVLLAENTRISFTTATYTSPPEIVSTTPPDGSVDVNYSPGTTLTIVFNQDMQSSWSTSTNLGATRTHAWLDVRTLLITFTNGLSPGSDYTITLNPTDHVSMASTSGSLLAENTTISFRTAYAIGSTGPAGGIVFYDKGSYSDGWRYLEAAPADYVDLINMFPWGGYNVLLGGTSAAIGSGRANTTHIVAQLGTGTTYAARLCAEYQFGGVGDWFLPSWEELRLMYEQRILIGGFNHFENYWSSTESTALKSYYIAFMDGTVWDGAKNNDRRVRAIRAF